MLTKNEVVEVGVMKRIFCVKKGIVRVNNFALKLLMLYLS